MLHFNKREYRRISAPNSCAMACSIVQYHTVPSHKLSLHFEGLCELLYQNTVYRRCFGTPHPFNGTSEFFSSFRRLSGGSHFSCSDASRAFFSILPFQLADRIPSLAVFFLAKNKVLNFLKVFYTKFALLVTEINNKILFINIYVLH